MQTTTSSTMQTLGLFTDESDASASAIVAVIYDADNNRLDNGNISIASN